MAQKKTILIVEDDVDIMRMISTYLKSNGYEVVEAPDGQLGIDLFQAHQAAIDLVLLDVMLPKKNGLEVLEAIRTESKVPVIMVTAMDQDYDQVLGLRKGADDYISKPFSPSVLLARIEAIVRRQPDKIEGYTVGSLTFDDAALTVIDHEVPLSLTDVEYRLLYFFATHPGQLIHEEQILEAIGYEGADAHPLEHVIREVRLKIQDGNRLIRVVHGAGYVFQPELK